MEPIREPRLDVTIADIAAKIRFARANGDGLGRVIFLIGAGCSVTAGIPGRPGIARRMVKDVALRFGCCSADADPADAYAALVARAQLDASVINDPPAGATIDWHRVYDDMFRRHYTAGNDVRDLFASVVGAAKGAINWAHLCLGELVERGYVSTVLTTNFDQLVLSGLTRAGVLPVVCDGLDSLSRLASAPRHPQLAELHGSLHTYRPRHVKPDDVASRSNPEAMAAIQQLFEHATTFVAIGYGGSEAAVMDLLTDAAALHSDKNLFWVNYAPDPNAISARVRKFLAASPNSALLPGQDADRFFLELCKALEIGVPRAISQPFGAFERIVADTSQSIVEDADIRAQLHATRSRLARLRALDAKQPPEDPIDAAVSAIREARLAGDPATAYRHATEALKWVNALASVDRRLTEAAAMAALEYGRATATRQPLEEAVQRFRFLIEQTRGDEAARPQWTASLGEALWRVGQTGPDRQGLEDGIAFLRRAADDLDRAQVPLIWAATNNNLGNALAMLGEREGSTARLEQAVDAYRAALQERTRERVPLDWAMTQNNLGGALYSLGVKESGTTRLEQAVEAYRAALQESTRDRVPLDWAVTQHNLGGALHSLGVRENGTARLEQAADAYRAALQERSRERVPLQWAYSQQGLGNALATVAARLRDPVRMQQALVLTRDAAEVYRQLGNSYWLPIAERRLAEMEAELTKFSAAD